MYKIEKNIEMPNPFWNGIASNKYPFKEMEIGDSFAVPVDPTTKLNYKQVAARMSTAISNHKKRDANTRFSMRTLKHDKCIRVWRTA